jgi:hypothetical protein
LKLLGECCKPRSVKFVISVYQSVVTRVWTQCLGLRGLIRLINWSSIWIIDELEVRKKFKDKSKRVNAVLVVAYKEFIAVRSIIQLKFMFSCNVFGNQFVDDICVEDITKSLIHGKFQN